MSFILCVCHSVYVGNYTQNRKLWKKENIYFIQNNSGIKGIYEVITKYCTEWVQQLFLFANCIWQSYPISHSLIPQIVTHSTMTCNKNCKLQHGNKSLLRKNCMVSCVMLRIRLHWKLFYFLKLKPDIHQIALPHRILHSIFAVSGLLLEFRDSCISHLCVCVCVCCNNIVWK